MVKDNTSQSEGKSPWLYFCQMAGLNLFIIIAIVALLLFGLNLWLDQYTRHSERIDVPSLSGVPAPEAQHYLEELGLKSLVIDSIYADNMRPGAVIEQMPAAGLPVKKGRIVYLTINALGRRMIRMQEVREGGSRQALSTLRSLGFVVDSVKQVASEMDDLVLSVTTDGIEMEPGREYPAGTRVVLRVGSSHMVIEPENDETEEAWLE